MAQEGLSVWELTGFHRKPDLMVIGGGLVGLFTAFFHQRAAPHHRVVVLERGAFPSGASVKIAGFACFGSPGELLADIDNEGLDRAMDRVTERWLGLKELRAELGDAAIDFEAIGGYEVYRTHDPLYTRVSEGFDRLNEALRPIFGKAVCHRDNEAPAAFGMKGLTAAVRTDFEGPLDSGRILPKRWPRSRS